MNKNPRQVFDNPDLDFFRSPKFEGQYFERKRQRHPREVAQIVCAFANSNDLGGLIVIGISDDGLINGISRVNVNDLLRYPEFVGHRCHHKFYKCANCDGREDEVMLVFVPPSLDRVVETSDGKAFIRQNDTTIELKHEKRTLLEHEKGQKSFEDEIACEYTADIIDNEILQEFLRLVKEKDALELQQDEIEILNARHLVKKQEGKVYLTKAGLLMFGKDPTGLIPGAYLRFQKYLGRERMAGEKQNVVKDEMFQGPIPKVIIRGRDFIRSQISDFNYLVKEGSFRTEPEYPQTVLDEALVNALVHRQYSLLNAPIFVNMFEDRIEYVSPGDYPPGVSPEHLIHCPRNTHLMQAMRYLEKVRMAGEGTLRMRNDMRTAGLPDPYYSPQGGPTVIVTLKNDIDERKSRFAGESAITESSNLFLIKVSPPEIKGDVPPEDMLPPSYGRVKHELVKKLKSAGFGVDSFTQSTGIDFHKAYDIKELQNSKLVTIYPGFHFRLYEFRTQLFLCLDHTVEVRSRATLDYLEKILPGYDISKIRKGFVRVEGEWKACFLQSASKAADIRVSLWDTKVSIGSTKDKFIPNLPTTVISEVLRASGLRFDLHSTIKRLSFSATQNGAFLRRAAIDELAANILPRIFPMDLDGYKLDVDRTRATLSPPLFRIGKNLENTPPMFYGSVVQDKVIDGLTRFGSYEKPEKAIPAVVLCEQNIVQKMQSLVEVINSGSMLYGGMEKTFAIKLDPVTTHVTSSSEEYAEACQQLVTSVPKNSIFLVHCSEREHSRADYNSPYFQVKNFLLEKGFPSQMVDDDTLANPKFKELNLALDIFSKAGFKPWVLANGLPEADLFVGLSYSTIRTEDGLSRLMAYVNVFDSYGKWLYYKGNAKPIPYDEKNKYLRRLLHDVAVEYKKKGTLQRLHVHHREKIRREDRYEITEGVKEVFPKAEISFVHLNFHTPVRLFDESPQGDGSLPRGVYVITGSNQFYISTTGFNPLGQKALGTPKIIEVNVNRVRPMGPLDLKTYAQHILSLTRLNWASTRNFCHEPITTKYASDIAYMMNVFIETFGQFNLHPDLERTPWFL